MSDLTESPTLTDLVQELRREVGLFDGAMSITPKAAWEEALARVRELRAGACFRCEDRYRWNEKQEDCACGRPLTGRPDDADTYAFHGALQTIVAAARNWHTRSEPDYLAAAKKLSWWLSEAEWEDIDDEIAGEWIVQARSIVDAALTDTTDDE